ncbi:MAG TPA: DUF4331 domain-containing protein, partial [Acidimicrobiales bacterium]|nr:DUF4331 domain-containing protein [Acidimicrobiales bacterium]
MRSNKRRLRVIAATGAAALVAASGLAVDASSHWEAPNAASDPQIDATDLYAFVSPDKSDTVTLISNWIPFQEPAGGPTFYPWSTAAKYDINIDNNGDAKADIVYRWSFTDKIENADTFLYATGPVNNLTDLTLNFKQTYKLEKIVNGQATTVIDNAPVAPSNVGTAAMPDYAKLRQQAVVPAGPGTSFVGQSDDPFFLDLRIFDLLYGANLKEVGNDTLDGYNVNTIALQVPKSELAMGGDANANPIFGTWTTASRPAMKVVGADGSVTNSGDLVQVSRLGNPLINEVVVPVKSKDLFNASKPEGDAAFLPKVENPEVPMLIEKIYGIKAPATPRADLVSVFLTGVEGATKPLNVTPSEQLRLNMSVPPKATGDRLGVIGGDMAGFPNGRRLSDDVVDIELQVLMGELVGSKNDLGDGVNNNDLTFGSSFPYVALPHSGSGNRNNVGKASGGSTPAANNNNSGSTSGSSGTSGTSGSSGSSATPIGGVAAGFGGSAGGGGIPAAPLGAA